jgi:hypothetical protein
MVINNFYIPWPNFGPNKANPVLVIHADRILPLPVSAVFPLKKVNKKFLVFEEFFYIGIGGFNFVG